MDTLRGTFGSGEADDRLDLDESREIGTASDEGEAARDLPPAAIGQDERRMQVRAYNHWASLLRDRIYPSIEDLSPEDLPDFGPYSVLLDFSEGIENPTVQYLGAKLAEECETPAGIEHLSDVPPRSLLSRITDHYMQIMANEAPIGFEAEFVNQRGVSILYRGILLPFSSDDDSIDFIYGVINWKEMADASTADELLLEIDQALDSGVEELPIAAALHSEDTIADWADSPANEAGEDEEPDTFNPDLYELHDNVTPIDADAFAGDSDGLDAENTNDGTIDLPTPDFGQYSLDDPEEDELWHDEDEDEGDASGSNMFASLADYIEAPSKKAVDLDADKFDPADYQIDEAHSVEPAQRASFDPDGEPDQELEAGEPLAAPVDLFGDLQQAAEPVETIMSDEVSDAFAQISLAEPAEDASLHDRLAHARQVARDAFVSEDRSRQALYAAVSRAYDFSLAAKDAPAEYDALIEESGLSVQERAPMTPVVKLVFGADYDKTRLTEYAAVLSHAHRFEMESGTLADYLAKAEGGLKGVVAAERRLRKEESGQDVEPEHQVREALAKKLRELEALTLDALASDGPEFTLVMVRRGGNDAPQLIGEISEDIGLIERAARKLVG